MEYENKTIPGTETIDEVEVLDDSTQEVIDYFVAAIDSMTLSELWDELERHRSDELWRDSFKSFVEVLCLYDPNLAKESLYAEAFESAKNKIIERISGDHFAIYEVIEGVAEEELFGSISGLRLKSKMIHEMIVYITNNYFDLFRDNWNAREYGRYLRDKKAYGEMAAKQMFGKNSSQLVHIDLSVSTNEALETTDPIEDPDL